MNSDDIRDIGFNKKRGLWEVRVWNPKTKKLVWCGYHKTIPLAQAARDKTYKAIGKEM